MHQKVGHKSHPHNQDLMDDLWIVNKLVRGRIICNFQRRPTTLFDWRCLLFISSLNNNLLYTASTRCFWFGLSLTSELFEKSGECETVFFFLEKITSCSCLDRFDWITFFIGMPSLVSLIDHYKVSKLKHSQDVDCREMQVCLICSHTGTRRMYPRTKCC